MFSLLQLCGMIHDNMGMYLKYIDGSVQVCNISIMLEIIWNMDIFVGINFLYDSKSILVLTTHFFYFPTCWFNPLRPEQYRHYFADYIFNYISLNENFWISLKDILGSLIDYKLALVQVIAWRLQVTSHNLNQFWWRPWVHMASQGLSELNAIYGYFLWSYFSIPEEWYILCHAVLFEWYRHVIYVLFIVVLRRSHEFLEP